MNRRTSTTGDSLYATLFLTRSADNMTIRRHYRKLALRYHPDKNIGSKVAEEKFKEINIAYTILTNPTKRKIYDKYGSRGLEIAEHVGEKKFLYLVNVFKVLFFVTGCFCCLCCFNFCCTCCCFYCCGLCVPNSKKEETDQQANYIDVSTAYVRTTTPSSGSNIRK